MDFISGVTLDNLVKYLITNQLDFRDYQILAISYVISYVLGKLGAHKHSDLKPDNIIIDGNFVAHVIDFGEMSAKKNFLISTTHAPHGNRCFSAPETEKLTYYPASDIYSLGCIIYNMIFKMIPFESYASKNNELLKKKQEKFERVHHLKAPSKETYLVTLLKQVDSMEKYESTYDPSQMTVRDELIEIIKKCTLKERESRPKAEELCELIRNIAINLLSPDDFDKFRLICLLAENEQYASGPFGTKEQIEAYLKAGFNEIDSNIKNNLNKIKEILNINCEEGSLSSNDFFAKISK
ncbi:protein kinase, putative [Trichomonas vaginalis G3]|uniref:Protein kinase, putative n=1 Tax=Trichomonas vaginalis (strain ATCC PRA-98 / G3) TaxID=412133 RepID=A2FEY4_TRIV3|nr:protein kinase-like (PK-like) family [Trichomonas vaginalis G3]EAX96538.1 protein kinase, putative [Trichomonas vaginalis G3]KAI5541094.1 protein kinase-like (PK-like) family [Trichomonas vaginalis G3]|eukprot:XP_001309468.1 protein kinase [Trichomonas vaginalis G3]